MDHVGYLEAVGQRFTEFGGFLPIPPETLPGALGQWADATLERVEPGLTTWVAFVRLQHSSLLPVLRDELAAHLADLAVERRTETLGVLLVVAEERIVRAEYDRLQPLIYQAGRVRVVPWVVDLTRGRLFAHEGPPFGIDPDLFMLAEPSVQTVVRPVEQRSQAERGPTPWLTIGMGMLLVAIWLVITAAGGSFTATESGQTMHNWGAATRPHLITHGEYWRLFTAGFLHFGLLHLLMNVLSLWWVGRIVEALYGPLRMLVVFAVALVAGAVASLIFGPPATVSAGASGAVLGLMGALLWYRLVGPQRERLKQVPLLVILGVNLIYGLILYRSIDNWAHLGGLLGGFIAAAAAGVPTTAARGLWRKLAHGLASVLLLGLAAAFVLGLVPTPGHAARLAGALAALEAGDWAGAEPGLRAAVRAQPDSAYLRLVMAWTYLGQGKLSEAQVELDRHFALDPASADGRELQERIRQARQTQRP